MIIKKVKFDTLEDAITFVNMVDYLNVEDGIDVYIDGYEGVSTYTVTIASNKDEDNE